MIDIHSHLNFPELANQIDKIVQKSINKQVKGIIIGSSNLKDSAVAISLAQKHPHFLFATVGIHPQNTNPSDPTPLSTQLDNLEKLIQNNRPFIVGIGETGLDFSPAPPPEKDRPLPEQTKLFLAQTNLSLKYNLPLIIHARQATDQVIDILQNHPQNSKLKGVFHCYSGGKKRIPKILNLPGNWYFGFDGNLTYDEGLQNIILQIPPKKILIETDSPFLTPAPYRDEPNTPAFLPLIQAKINQLFGQDLTAQILQNTLSLFNLNL